jgi:hypothetical protein
VITTNRCIVTGLLFFLLTCPCLLFGQKVPNSVPKCSELVFSDVHYVPEADDYVGTEIVLKVCRNQQAIKGEWNEYEGGHTPATTKLNGRRSGAVVRLSGSNSEGKVDLSGRLNRERLTGKLLWYIGRNQQEKILDLVKKEVPVRPPR